MGKKNIVINGKPYQNVSNIKVRDVNGQDMHDFRNTDDADIQSSDVLLGKVGYGKDGKVIGTAIQTSGEIDGGINFYDQYGAWLTSYSLSDLPLSALPEIPALEGAGADQYEFAWTMTLEEVNALTEEADIGVDVTAKEGAKTYLIPNEFGFSGSTGSFWFYGGDEASTILIDWGDGTANTTLNIRANTRASTSHNFTTTSYNPITISLVSGGEFYLGGNGSSYYFLTASYSLGKRTQELRVGSGIKGLTTYWVNSYNYLEKILLHNGLYSVLGTTGYLFSGHMLKSLNIPKSFKEITATVVSNVYALEHLYIHNGLESSATLASSAYFLKKLVFPETYKTCSSTSIYSTCDALKAIKFPKTPISIKDGTLSMSFSTFSAIELSNFIAEKYNQVCYNNRIIKEVEIPEGVKELSNSCFSGCYNLESVILPASLESITNSNNFYSCYNIKQLIFKGTTPPIVSSELLSNSHENCKVYVPKGSLEAYATATNLVSWAEQMVEY